MDKDQQGILSKDEIELIRSSFSGKGEDVLYQIRNVFLQFDYKEFNLSDEILSIIKKFLTPSIGPDTPLKVQSDLYFSLDTLKQIPPEVAFLHIRAMDIMVEYLEQQFIELTTGTKGDIELSELKELGDKDDEQRFVDMIAYQSIVPYIDSSLDRLRIIANSKDETEEEKKKRMELNSTK